MKKILFSLLALVVCTTCVLAQGCPSPSSATASVTFRRPIPGMLTGVFSVSSTTKISFSQGNLQYRAAAAGTELDPKWRFAEHQWDYVGNSTYGNVFYNAVKCNNESAAADYTGWIDLFGWATSGWNNGNRTAYQPYSTSTNASHYGVTNPKSAGESLTGDYANGDWGVYNSTALGTSGWRTLTSAEWKYLLETRTTSSGVRFVKATVNGVKGLIILPDDWNTSYYALTNANNGTKAYDVNVIASSTWTNDLEAHGAVFLPSAGYRNGTSVGAYAENPDTHPIGYYWSVNAESNLAYVYGLRIRKNAVASQSTSNYRFWGFSVRLVHE